MPAGVPPKEAVTNDVKSTGQSPETDNNKPEMAANASPSEVDLSEDDLKVIEEQKSVPYSRFKEVNEKMRTYKAEADEMKSQFTGALEKTIAEYEAKLKVAQSTPKDDYGIEYDEKDKEIVGLKDELKSLKKSLHEVVDIYRGDRLDFEMERLTSQYPKADREYVKYLKDKNPRSSIGELMEMSHKKNLELVEGELKSLLETKKRKASESLIPQGRGTIKLKDTERPKTLSEANKLAKRYFTST